MTLHASASDEQLRLPARVNLVSSAAPNRSISNEFSSRCTLYTHAPGLQRVVSSTGPHATRASSVKGQRRHTNETQPRVDIPPPPPPPAAAAAAAMSSMHGTEAGSKKAGAGKLPRTRMVRIKIISLGDCGVGKSCLIKRCVTLVAPCCSGSAVWYGSTAAPMREP